MAESEAVRPSIRLTMPEKATHYHVVTRYLKNEEHEELVDLREQRTIKLLILGCRLNNADIEAIVIFPRPVCKAHVKRMFPGGNVSSFKWNSMDTMYNLMMETCKTIEIY